MEILTLLMALFVGFVIWATRERVLNDKAKQNENKKSY